MKTETIKSIFNQFEHKSNYVSHSELNSGHINDTFLVKTDGEKNYILQRINNNIFKDVPGLVNNKVLISNHIKNKFTNLSENELSKKVLSFVKTKHDAFYYYKENRDFWNVMVFIDASITHEIVKHEEIAYEGGKLLGEFLNQTSDFDSTQLIDVIPNFHDMSFRYKQYASSLLSASNRRLQKAAKYTKLVADLKDEMHILQRLKETGKIPLRVTHNDTKISNSLFDKNNKGVCMIDTDTVMPGIIHYDFGDAVRTICNNTAEDETDLTKVEFNLNYYKAYEKGFLEQTKDALSETELKHLPLAAKTMIFIMGIRFLTDYLNNDIYYKISYSDHNLDRAKNQFKLLENFSKNGNEVIIIDSLRTGFENNLKGLNVKYIKGDIRDVDLLNKVASNVDCIFHLAALVSVPESLLKIEECIEINSIGTINVLEAAKNNTNCKVVLSTSAANYGDNPLLPKVETMVPEPMTPYSITKLDGEYYLKMYLDQFNLQTASLRYFNVFGPRQDPKSAYAAAVPIFISKALQNKPITIYGDGLQTRDFIYVKDVVRANVMASEKGNGTFNVALGNSTSILELAEKIIKLTNSKSEIKFLDARSGDIKHSRADVTKFKEIGFVPKYSLDEALEETIAFYHNQLKSK